MRLAGSRGAGTDSSRTTTSEPAHSWRLAFPGGSVAKEGDGRGRTDALSPGRLVGALVASRLGGKGWWSLCQGTRNQAPSQRGGQSNAPHSEKVHLLILFVVLRLKPLGCPRLRLPGRPGPFDRAPLRRRLLRQAVDYHFAPRHPRPRWQPPALCVRWLP